MLSTINKEVRPADCLPAKDKRILWLINHTTLREFEVPLLISMGFEVFTPKCIPEAIYGWSGSVDYTSDSTLTIPADIIKILNDHNFYDNPITPTISEIINEYFGSAICVFWQKMLIHLTKKFNGRILLRAFGLDKNTSYTKNIIEETGNILIDHFQEIADRFWFAQCYSNLHEVECDLFKNRKVTLPLGLPQSFYKYENTWVGGLNKILFFCPRITASADYYGKIYQKFKQNFGDLPYTIAGTQPDPVKDKQVVGYQKRTVIDEWLQQYAVMFYHSEEPRHIHYHPLEAIIFGMPLIYMRDGMLGKLGGENQPGACVSYQEARKKIKRILQGDKKFIEEIRQKQKTILNEFNLEFIKQAWEDQFVHIILKKNSYLNIKKKPLKKIAVFLPIPYQGGSLNGAKNIAKMIYLGSRHFGEDESVQVIFSYVAGHYDVIKEFSDLKELGIQIRETTWHVKHVNEVNFSCNLMSKKKVNPFDEYLLPIDGINNFNDCDFWLVISDRLTLPLAPLKPYALMVYDYIQRYYPDIVVGDDTSFLATARGAEFILTTTPTTMQDAIQYAGVHSNRVYLAPMEFNPFKDQGTNLEKKATENYILWPSNTAKHKNHMATFEALELYYSKYNGKYLTYLTGYMTQNFNMKLKNRNKNFPHIEKAVRYLDTTKYLKENIRFLGNISTEHYISLVANAKFLIHPTLIDNGTYSVIEAAYHGTPSLSSNYPQMHFINERFRLNLCFFDQTNSKDIAEKIKIMEEQHDIRRKNLPSREFLDQFSYENIASEFWKLVRSLI